jgi:hypothetical protein
MFPLRSPGLIALALAALVFGGCQSTYHERNASLDPLPLLRSDTRIYVGMPFDASDRKEVAFQSGKKAAEALYTAFSRNTKPVFISRGPESLSEALENARRFNAKYLVYPTIKLWEDRATEWSGRRDKVDFRVDVIDLATSRNVYWKEFEATGRFMTDGGDTPADLLQQPVDQFAATLFRRTETPSALR